MSRMSNTAEILANHFCRLQPKIDDDNRPNEANDDNNINNNTTNHQSKIIRNYEWTFSKFLRTFFNDHNDFDIQYLIDQSSIMNNDDQNEIEQEKYFCSYYQRKFRINFFIWFLLLKLVENFIEIITIFFYEKVQFIELLSSLIIQIASTIIYSMFLLILSIDERIFHLNFNRFLSSMTIFITIVFENYLNDCLDYNNSSNFGSNSTANDQTINQSSITDDHQSAKFSMLKSYQKCPIFSIIITINLLLLFKNRSTSLIISILLIIFDSLLRFDQRIRFTNDQSFTMIIQLMTIEVLSYLTIILIIFYIKFLFEYRIEYIFRFYIKFKFDSQQIENEQQQILTSCLPQHLIANVRKDLREFVSKQYNDDDDEEEQHRSNYEQKFELNQRFKKLYVKKYDNVSILFADTVNSVKLIGNLLPENLVEMLNDLFDSFDMMAVKNNCLRIKLLGDCYYCVSGLPLPDPNHAFNCLKMGIDMIHIINQIRQKKSIDINMRIGIHSGMVQSGIIGLHKWQFDIWSLDCEEASRMEHDGRPGYIHVTSKTYHLLPKECLKEYIVEKNNSNGKTTYLITEKRKNPEQITMNRSISDNNENNETQSTNFDRKQSTRISFENNERMKTLINEKSKQIFIENGIEKISFNFEKNFKNFLAINPVTLTFTDKPINENDLSIFDKATSPNNYNNNDENADDTDDHTESTIKLSENHYCQWLNDEFFNIHLFWTLFICTMIMVIKLIIYSDKLNQFNQFTLTMVIIIIMVIIIPIILFVSLIYCTYNNASKLKSYQHNLIYLTIIITVLSLSFFDIFSIGEFQITAIDSQLLFSNYIICLYISNIMISIFISINFWFKLLTRLLMLSILLLLLLLCSQNLSKYQLTLIIGEYILNFIITTIILTIIIDREYEYLKHFNYFVLKLFSKQNNEKIINEILLKNILPATNIVRNYLNCNQNSLSSSSMKLSNRKYYSESYDFIVVMFASIPNYSEFYSENRINKNGQNCLKLLNEIICDFDSLLMEEKFKNIEKIKTISSTYMAASGLKPGSSVYNHKNAYTIEQKQSLIIDLIVFAMELMKKINIMNRKTFQEFKLRIGIACGPVVAGIVGKSKPQYDIWGDTVNVASRMESNGIMGRIQMTQEMANILLSSNDRMIEYENKYQFTIEKRNEIINVKGKGLLITYLAKTPYDFVEPTSDL